MRYDRLENQPCDLFPKDRAAYVWVRVIDAEYLDIAPIRALSIFTYASGVD